MGGGGGGGLRECVGVWEDRVWGKDGSGVECGRLEKGEVEGVFVKEVESGAQE